MHEIANVFQSQKHGAKEQRFISMEKSHTWVHTPVMNIHILYSHTIFSSVHTHSGTHIHSCSHKLMLTHTYAYMHTLAHTHAHIHSCSHTLTYTHAHVHTHIHSHVHTHFFPCFSCYLLPIGPTPPSFPPFLPPSFFPYNHLPLNI